MGQSRTCFGQTQTQIAWAGMCLPGLHMQPVPVLWLCPHPSANPGSVSSPITPQLVIPWWLRGLPVGPSDSRFAPQGLGRGVWLRACRVAVRKLVHMDLPIGVYRPRTTTGSMLGDHALQCTSFPPRCTNSFAKPLHMNLYPHAPPALQGCWVHLWSGHCRVVFTQQQHGPHAACPPALPRGYQPVCNPQ